MNVPDKNSAPRRQQQAFLLRLPQSLKEHLKQQAKANSRSLNSEILAMLHANASWMKSPRCHQNGRKKNLRGWMLSGESTSRKKILPLGLYPFWYLSYHLFL